MADNSRNAMASTTANTPSSTDVSHRKSERTTVEGGPPSSNAWVAMTPDAIPEVERVVEMTKEDEKHMREDLGRDPEQLVKQQTEAEKGLQERQHAYNDAAPGNTLAEMATGGREGEARVCWRRVRQG